MNDVEMLHKVGIINLFSEDAVGVYVCWSSGGGLFMFTLGKLFMFHAIFFPWPLKATIFFSSLFLRELNLFLRTFQWDAIIPQGF